MRILRNLVVLTLLTLPGTLFAGETVTSIRQTGKH